MKKRIFARGIKKFVNIDLVTANDGSATLTLIEDGAHPSMTMQWRVEGAAHVGAIVHALRERDLLAMMDVLDHYTGHLPMLEVAPELANAA